MSDEVKKSEKRVPWVTIAGVSVILLTLLLITPTLVAQSLDGKTQRLLYMFEYVFSFVEKNYVDAVEPETLIEGAMKGMFESLGDPHSAYLTATDMRSLNDTTAGEFGGVGLYINKQIPSPETGDKTSFVEVIAPIEDTPAFKAGVQAGDLIVKIEGESTEKLAIDEVVSRLRGKPGSDVTVTLKRGASLVFDLAIKRAVIQVPTVKWAMMPEGIGYIRIIQFTPYTADRVREAVGSFQTAGYSRLVIDLRGNPGGLLGSVVETADLFFDDGPIVSTKSRLPSENAVFEAKPGVLVPAGLPMAVLIDNGSASASEIFAGVMKDRGRATLFGTKTYGKGSVQQVHGIGSGGFRLTMSRYYTPSGVTIDKVGVSPDREVKEPELTETELAAYSNIISERTVPLFIQQNPAPTEAQTEAFVQGLVRKTPALAERILKRMVRNEINRHLPDPPVYNLEFDIVLQAAVKFLKDSPR